MNKPIQNIFNNGREITLFLRNSKGEQEIETVNDFFPYYYEENSEGKCKGFDGTPLKQHYVSYPKQIKEQRSSHSWESDIQPFSKRFMIDKIDTIEKSPTRYNMIDIETLSKELPRPKENGKAKDKVSCITLYDNYTKKYDTFYLGDYDSEYKLITDFIKAHEN